MVKITVDIGDQYQYAGALTAIEKAAQCDSGKEDDVHFEIDDIQNLVEATNQYAKRVNNSFPSFDENSKSKTLEGIDELKEKVEKLK
jgi:hypothetical protein